MSACNCTGECRRSGSCCNPNLGTYGAYKHKIDRCDLCERDVVICGKCGNNTCNAGYGEVIGSEPGSLMECDACPSAYAYEASRHAINVPKGDE